MKPKQLDTVTLLQYRTGRVKKLKSLGVSQVSVKYDPVIFSNPISAIIGPTEITVWDGDLFFMFPLSKKAYKNYREIKYKGYISKFEPDSMIKGEEPTATISIEFPDKQEI